MAAITPTNGRVAFLALHDPHTYWVLDSTDLGTNYGDDGSAGGGDIVTVSATDIGTALGYEGMKDSNAPPANGWFDLYTVTDAAALLYIPSGLATGDVYGLFDNGGASNAQSGFLRATATGVEVAIVHNTGGASQDNMVYEIPTADLDGWHCIGWQFASEGGAQGDMGLWVNGVKVADGTRVRQLAWGSGDPDFGDSGGREPTVPGGISPYGADVNWTNESSINGSGILIANFVVDNPGQANVSPAGNGDSFHEDYYTAHTVSAGPTITDVETTDTFDDGDTAVTITGTTFEASQGTGTVELASSSDYGAATKVSQTVTSWADTAIDFTASLGALTPGTLYLFVTNDSGDRSAGHEVTVGAGSGTAHDETITDTVGATDQIEHGKAIALAITDSIGVADQVGRAVAKVRALTDSAGITDAAIIGQGHGRNVTDSIGATDTASAQQSGTATDTVTDSAGITDDVAAALAAARAQADAIGISDAIVVAVDRSATIVDQVDSADTIGRVITADRVLVGDVAIAETTGVDQTLSGEESATDPVGITDTADRDLESTRTAVDDVAIADQLALALAADRDLADQVGVTDSIVVDFTGTETETQVDLVGLADVIVVEVAKTRTVFESVGILDPVAAAMAFAREIDDELAVTDTATGATAAAGVANYGYRAGRTSRRWAALSTGRRWGTRETSRRWGTVVTRRTP